MSSLIEQQLLSLGITMAVSTSNAGPAGFTVSDAAAGIGALAVGRSARPLHVRP